MSRVGSSDCCLLHKPKPPKPNHKLNPNGSKHWRQVHFSRKYLWRRRFAGGPEKDKAMADFNWEAQRGSSTCPSAYQPASQYPIQEQGWAACFDYQFKNIFIVINITEYSVRAYLPLKNKVVHQPLWYQFAYTSFDLPACLLSDLIWTVRIQCSG
jgi:hypothetical protein